MNYKRKFKQKRMDNITMPTIQELYFHGRNGELSPAWIFNGSGWTDKLKVRANSLLFTYMKFKQGSAFNYWKLVTKGNDNDWVIASRFTWEFGYIGGSWKKLEEDLNNYYEKGSNTIIKNFKFNLYPCQRGNRYDCPRFNGVICDIDKTNTKYGDISCPMDEWLAYMENYV